MGFEPTTFCMASSGRYAVEAYAPALEAGSRRLVVRRRLRDSTPFTGSFRTESGLTCQGEGVLAFEPWQARLACLLGGAVQFCQLGEIYAVAWSIGGAFHRSQVGEGADRSDGVRRDFDADLISSQLGEARYPLHSI